MVNPDYIPFDHTYIVYDPSRPETLVLALSSIFPILILVFLFSWFLVTREIECCIIAGGQVINDFISTILKDCIQFERPVNGQIFKKEGRLVYGMPSSHSQFVAFFSVYILLKMRYQWPYPIDPYISLFCEGLLVIAVGLITYSRLFFEYHTLNQVLVGCLLGGFVSTAYFVVVSILRDYGVTDWLLGWRICKVLGMKDTFHSREYRRLGEEREEWERNHLAK